MSIKGSSEGSIYYNKQMCIRDSLLVYLEPLFSQLLMVQLLQLIRLLLF